MMTGLFISAADSSTAFTLSVPTTLAAGSAYWFAFASSNTFCTSSPVTTPAGMSFIFPDMINKPSFQY
jgi:hypothetical protein